MARKKHGKPAKLPKRIAGVKVPKELREPGGRLLAALTDPIVIDAAAAALAAAATRLAAGLGNVPPAPKTAAPRELGAILAATALEGVRRIGEPRPPARKP